MKIIGTNKNELCLYAFDCHSILHFIAGIIAYIIIYTVGNLIIPESASFFVAFIGIILMSIIWEILENTIFVGMKPNGNKDDILNSQCDTFCVFFGGIIGIFVYKSSITIAFIIIGILFLIYIILEILTSTEILRKK